MSPPIITRMRLPDFIEQNLAPILVDWEDFARSIWPKESEASPVELRDSAEQILRAVVADMRHDQSTRQQYEKSMGRGDSGEQSDNLDDASSVHGIARVASGLNILEVVAEYRALRASILRQWQNSQPSPDTHDLDDITRFNEAIDQSLTRAIASFTKRLDESRKMFLAILGHDLRTPLSAITLSASLAQEPGPPEEQAALLSTISASASAISNLIADLIDFTSSTLGVQFPIKPEKMDLASVCRDVVRESRSANPGRAVELQADGDLSGQWDAHRLRQVVANLLGNAMQHGDKEQPITILLDGHATDAVVLSVHNHGAAIPPDVLPTIFDPLVRGRSSVQSRTRPGSIGLGLYIAREITLAHEGTITLCSTDSEGTTATVRLPR